MVSAHPQIRPPVPNCGALADTSRVGLLERQTQLEELARHLRAAAGGTGKIVFVSGEAGAGKSAVVEMFAQQAPRGTRLLWGHCDALQTSRVLGPVHEVASGLSLPQASSTEVSAREPLFGLLLERLSPPHPVTLVVLEDIHWADEATLDLVRFLGRRIQRTRCLLIATHRDDELPATHPLRAVLGELIGQHAARLRIPPLSLSAVEQLARGYRGFAGGVNQGCRKHFHAVERGVHAAKI